MPISPFSTKKRHKSWRRHSLSALLLSILSLGTSPAQANPGGELEAALALPPSSPARTSSRLEEWLALTGPGGAAYPPARYAAFLRQSPAWPLQKRIEWRYEHALLAEQDSLARRDLCPAFPISRSDLLLACAPYLTDLPAQARRLWREAVTGSEDEQPFLSAFSRYLNADDELVRYIRLEHTGPYAAAQRQARRLSGKMQPLLAARLANHFSRPDADTLFLSHAGDHDGGLTYYRLKYLRLHDRLDEALQLWPQAELLSSQALPSPDNVQWQDERTALVRVLLRNEQANATDDAARLLNTVPESDQTADTHLLSGYIALICQHDPVKALPHFKALVAEKDLNKRAAGLYWMGRSSEARHSSYATEFYKKAANFPTSFYGQLSLARLLHAPLLTSSSRSQSFLKGLQKQLTALPEISTSTRLPRPDLAESASRLQQKGDLINAALFLTYLQVQTRDDIAAQPAIARLAFSLHLPKVAIFAARQMARYGKTLYPSGYPGLEAPSPSTLPNGLLPALTRQESSMDNFAVSPRHAYGLTQLLLPTAMLIAHRHKLPYRPNTPLSLMDPNVNLSIGGLYIGDLLTRYEGVLPYALAAYNAGPSRSQKWQAEMHSPTVPQIEDEDRLLRWTLLLPYKETRLYIEHIEADMSLYAAMKP